MIVGLLLVANTINIAADIGAMGEALQMIVGGPEHGHAVVFAIVVVLLQVYLPYQRLAPLLKWFTLALFAYVAVLFTIAVPWQEVVFATLLPRIEWSAGYMIDAGGRARYDDQPLPLLLAGRAGGGGDPDARRSRAAL